MPRHANDSAALLISAAAYAALSFRQAFAIRRLLLYAFAYAFAMIFALYVFMMMPPLFSADAAISQRLTPIHCDYFDKITLAAA